MEPKQPSMNNAPEMPRQNPAEFGNQQGNTEVNPGLGQGYEQLPQRNFEQMPAPQEQLAPPPAMIPIPQAPAAPPVTPPASVQAPPVDNTPTVANDDDLIEKEWVDKAKQVIAETKDDPALRESEIQKLKLDYIKKRYGREIGGSRD